MARAAALGALSGFAAGTVSGFVLHYLWALPPLSLLLAQPPSPELGWLVHLTIAIIAGMLFGMAALSFSMQSRAAFFASGIIAGALVFVLGPLTFVPMVIGLRPQFPYIAQWLPVGASYLAFGAMLGAFHYTAVNMPSERRV